jgi:hypothetical protein
MAKILPAPHSALPLLDDLQSFVDLAAQVRVGEVVVDERRACAAAFFCWRYEVAW